MENRNEIVLDRAGFSNIDIDAEKVGKTLRELRKEFGFSAEVIRGFLGLETDQAIYNWESGRCLPRIEHLYALSQVYGYTVDEIIRMSNRHKDEEPRSTRFSSDDAIGFAVMMLPM